MLNQELIDFANNLADISALIAKKYFRKDNGEIAKADDSPVTKADREIEAAIREEIVKKYPSHGIIGEEYDNINEEAPFQWIIDPIDGTSSFITGRPIFGTLIALAQNKESVFGLMNQPITGERFVGIQNGGAFLNDQKLQSRKCKSLNEAVLATTSPFFFVGDDEKKLKNLSSKTKYQNYGGIVYGGDCYLYAMVAAGQIDIVIDPGLKIFDYAALIPIIEEAGGVVSDWEGNKLELKNNARMLACSSEKVWHAAIEVINSKSL